MLRFVSPIRTLTELEKKEHSGTALMIAAPGQRVYCLTADHVLSPENRLPKSSMRAKCHFHTGGLRIEGNSSEFMLRRRFYRSEQLDIAIAESSSSGSGMAALINSHYVPLQQLLMAEDVAVFDDDMFLFAGFPASRAQEQPTVRHSRYGLHTFYFRGKDRFSNSVHEPLYEIETRRSHSPGGMSGAPIWMIRKTENPEAPLLLNELDPEKIDGLNLTLFFYGIVIRFKQSTNRFVAIKPGACRMFIGQNIDDMDNIRHPKEHQSIEEYSQFVLSGGYDRNSDET